MSDDEKARLREIVCGYIKGYGQVKDISNIRNMDRSSRHSKAVICAMNILLACSREHLIDMTYEEVCELCGIDPSPWPDEEKK